MPSTGYKTDSLKRGDSSRELKGVSNKELNFISYAAGEPLKILRQGTLWSALLLRKIDQVGIITEWKSGSILGNPPY